MLNITDVSAAYGDLRVLFNVSMHVNEGECVAIVGSNGAGKTTLLRIISGLMPVTSGTMSWYETDMLKLPARARAHMGIAHIPQGRGILGTLTVTDNLIMGGYDKRVKKNRLNNIERMMDMFPRLRERKNQIAGSLSGGEQQMLAIARALVMEPKLLILDEPSLGLAPIVVDNVFQIIKDVREQGISILIVEQNLYQALNVADRGYVLETGQLVMEGGAQELLNNQDIKKAYLAI